MKKIKVLTRAAFSNEGCYVKRNAEILVTPARAKALLANRLIYEPAAEKSEKEPENKAKPKPSNKAVRTAAKPAEKTESAAAVA